MTEVPLSGILDLEVEESSESTMMNEYKWRCKMEIDHALVRELELAWPNDKGAVPEQTSFPRYYQHTISDKVYRSRDDPPAR